MPTQIYAGPGRGKSTAAYGLALRAAGAGLRVFILQFMKAGFPYKELTALSRLAPEITVVQRCGDAFVIEKRPPNDAELAEAAAALDEARTTLVAGRYDVVILDEICVAVHFGLIPEPAARALIASRPDSVELILTGRYCPEAWFELADLVTEMREVKHYYQQGVTSREGFDC